MINFLLQPKSQKHFVGIQCSVRKQPNHYITIPHWKFLLGSTPCTFKTLKKIPANTKYVVGISFYYHFLTQHMDPIFSFLNQNNRKNKQLSHFLMPDRVKEDSKNGLVHWLVDYSTECNQLDQSSSMINFSKLCDALYTTPNNITLITGAETKLPYGTAAKEVSNEHGYNIATGHSLFKFLELENQRYLSTYIEKKTDDIKSSKLLNYKSLCYNRLPRHHRTVIVAHIINNKYQDQCLYSLGTFENHGRWHWKNSFPKLESEIESLINGPEIYPHIRESGVNLRSNQAHKLGWDHGLNSYFQLVTETTPDNSRYPFITEKSLKPFAMMQPFIQYGPKDNVKNLKLYGFEIFDKWIDHSYDDEDDDIIRLQMVLKEFDRLQNIPNKQWSAMLIEMLESIMHNLDLVQQPPKYCSSSQLVPILTRFVEGN